MNKKIEKKYGIPIILLVMSMAIISILTQHFPSASKEQDKLIDSTLVAIGVSVLGLILLILKKATNEKYVTESLEVLLFIMVPVTTFIPLLADPKIFWIFLPIYYGGIIGWFLSVNYFIIKTKNRNDEQKIAASAIKRIFGYMMALSIFLFFLYWTIILPQLVHNVS